MTQCVFYNENVTGYVAFSVHIVKNFQCSLGFVVLFFHVLLFSVLQCLPVMASSEECVPVKNSSKEHINKVVSLRSSFCQFERASMLIPMYYGASMVVPHAWFVTVIYSGISNGGCSKVRTASLQRTHLSVPKYFLPIFSIHFELPNEGQPSYKGQNNCPKVSFIWRFHCIVTCVTSMIMFIE